MLGRQDAQFVGAALEARLITPKGARATPDVAGQGVMAGGLVILGVMVVAPHGRSQPVTELGAGLQACMGRAVEGLEDVQRLQLWHGVFSDTPHPTLHGWRCEPIARQKRKNVQEPARG